MDQVVGLVSSAVSSPTGKAVAGTSVAVAICSFCFDYLKTISVHEFQRSCDKRHDVFVYGYGFVILVLVVTFFAQAFVWFKNENTLELKVKDLLEQIEEEKLKRVSAERERDREKEMRRQAEADCEAAKQNGQQVRREKDELAEETGRLTLEKGQLQVSNFEFCAIASNTRFPLILGIILITQYFYTELVF